MRSTLVRAAKKAMSDAVRIAPPPRTGQGVSGAMMITRCRSAGSPPGFGIHLPRESRRSFPGKPGRTRESTFAHRGAQIVIVEEARQYGSPPVVVTGIDV